MLSAQQLKCPSSPTSAVQNAEPLTFDIPQGEVTAGGFRGQGEHEAMSILRLVPIHHANGVDQLVKRGQAVEKGQNEDKTTERVEINRRLDSLVRWAVARKRRETADGSLKAEGEEASEWTWMKEPHERSRNLLKWLRKYTFTSI